MSWYWKWKSTWKEDLITYNSHHWIICFMSLYFLLIDCVTFGERGIGAGWGGGRRGGSFEIGCPRRSKWLKNFGSRWTRLVEGILKIEQFWWTSYVVSPFAENYFHTPIKQYWRSSPYSRYSVTCAKSLLLLSTLASLH